MKKAFVMIITGLAASALLLTALSYIVYGRSPQATVYEWMLRRRYASHRTAEEEAERLRKRARKDEPSYELPEDLKFQSDIQEIDWHGLQVFALNPEARAVTAVYLHGGAYINPFNEYQWRFMDRLAAEAGICVLAPVKMKPIKASRRKYSVRPMPTQPTIKPMGMPTAERSRASYSTLRRICFFVAPTLLRMPNWRVRSLTEIEKEL